MLKIALIAKNIIKYNKITALKSTENPLIGRRKPSSLVPMAIVCSSVGIKKFPEKASHHFSQ